MARLKLMRLLVVAFCALVPPIVLAQVSKVRICDSTGSICITPTGGALPVTGGSGGGTVNQGTPAVVGNAWPFLVTDGVHHAAVINTSPSGTEYGLVVRIIGGGSGGTSSSFAAAFPATGTAIGAIDASGNMAGLTLNGLGYLLTDSSGTTQPVSGTLTVQQASRGNLLGNMTLQLAGVDVAAGNPVPVTPGSGAVFPASQSGTWNVGLNTGTNTIGKVNQGAAGVSAWPVDATGSSVTVTGSVAVTGPLTDAQLRASAVPISAASLPLPTGAATQSTLSTISGQLPAALDGSGFLKVHEQGTAAISAASLPLPTGAATAANQAPAVARAGFQVTGSMNGVTQVTSTTNGATSVSVTGAGTATSCIFMEGSADGGASWFGISGVPVTAATSFYIVEASANILPAGGAPQVVILPDLGGITNVRTNYCNSGTFTGPVAITMSFTYNNASMITAAPFWFAYDSTAYPGGSIMVGGKNGSGNAQSLSIATTTPGGSDPGVVVRSAGTTTVSGTVTANAGTNLNTSALALDATAAKLNLAQGSTTSGQTGPLVQGAVSSSAPTYSNGQTSPISLTTGGAVRVDGTGTTQNVTVQNKLNVTDGSITVTSVPRPTVNLSQYSTDQTQSVWGKLRTTASAGTGPGNTSGTLVAETATTGAHRVSQVLSASILNTAGFTSGVAEGVFTLSVTVNVASGTSPFVALSFDGSHYSFFNASTGALGTVHASHIARIVSVPDQAGTVWYRCSITSKGIVLANTIFVNMASADTVISYAGSVSNTDVFYNIQMEPYDGVGTSVVTSATPGLFGTVPWTQAPTGTASPQSAQLVGGTDSAGNLQGIRMATDGTVRVDPTGTTTQPVSGTVAATQSGSWSVTSASADTTVGATNLTAACSSINSCGANTTSSIAMAGQYGASVTFTSGCTATATFDVSNDGGTTWSNVTLGMVTPAHVNATSITNPATNAMYSLISPLGTSNARVRLSAFSSGTCTVKLRATSNEIVSAYNAAGAMLTDGSAVTQPVSGTVAISAGSAVIGHVIADSGSTTAVTGTVATNVSQINGVTPLMGNGVTGTGSQRVTIASDNTAFGVKTTDGTNTMAVKAASTAAAATDPSSVTQLSPNQPQLTTPLNTSDAATGSTSATSPTKAGLAGANVIADGAVTATTAGQMEALTQDKQKRLYVRDYGANIFVGSTGGSTVTATTEFVVPSTGSVIGLSGASLSYYITDVVLSNGATAQTIQLISSTTSGTACASSPVNVGPPFSFPINGGMVDPGKTPVKVTANSTICCKPSGGTAFSCEIRGFIAP